MAAGGARRGFEDDEFPLALGGGASAVELEGTALAAHLGLDGEEIFIQPVPGGPPVACNGSLLSASRWLRQGDLLRVGDHRLRCADAGDSLELAVVERPPPSPPEPRLVPPPRPPAGGGETPARIRPLPYAPPRSSATRRLPGWLPWRTLGLLALAAVLLLPAWFLFTARSVVIEVEPAAESLRLSGPWPRPRVLDAWLLRPGGYRVHAARPGYRVLDAELAVGPEPRQVARFELVELPGLLTVRTVPPTGAAVWIDGEPAGREPLVEREVERGERRLRIAADGWVEHRQTVAVEGGGARREIAVELVPLFAPVSVRSRPPGARVVVDGVELGVTPSTHRLAAGARRLELRLGGYQTARRRFEVEPDTPLELPLVELAPAAGNLSVASEPPGAAVAVDGVFRGLTPLDLDLAAGAEHRLVVTLAGHRARRDAVRLAPEESRELFVELEPERGEVEVVVRPAGAEVWIDGARAEAGVRELLAVPHEIEVRMPGYRAERRTVTPRPGFRQTLEVTLETAEEAAARAVEPVIRTAQGQELRLVGPGALTMGAPRREPGRRANETLRQVEITRAFYLGSREVTNREYGEFDPEHRSGRAGQASLELDDQPVVRVTWEDAVRYCNWLSGRDSLPPFYRPSRGAWVAARPLTTGYRLPLESEWAFAARYPDGRNALKYPWGEALPVPEGAGNYADASAAGLLSSVLPGYRDGYPATAPVGSFRPNALGLFDLGGNVAEWVHDVYSLYAGGGAAERDPMGPEDGELHVIRGAGWMHDSVTELRLSFRDHGREPRPDVGFRIARFLEAVE